MTADRDPFPADEGPLFDEQAAIGVIDRRGDADIAARRLIGHAAVLHWLSGWGGNLPLSPLPWPE